MEHEAFRNNAYDMIYLTKCAIHGEAPDADRISGMDLDGVFAVCQRHILTACGAYALDAAGVQHPAFREERDKAVRKNILFDAERAKILKAFEAEGIWYMPLKGSLLKNWYPRLGMRQMSDNDILYDESCRAKVRDLMTGLGFDCDHFGRGKDDAYFKKPVLNFEMHYTFFEPVDPKPLYEYYSHFKEHLIKDEGNDYGYHFSHEDFYLYLIAHEYKHYIKGGTGVRSLSDSYVFLQKFGDSLDWDYLNGELDKMGIRDYADRSRELALKVFGSMDEPKLSTEERRFLDLFIFSGTYGTAEQDMENRLENEAGGSKVRLFFRRLFPPMENIKAWWPFFYRHKWLLPVLWFIVRPIDALVHQRGRLRKELRFIFHKQPK